MIEPLDLDQSFTYIVANDPPPSSAGVTWLPWGPTSFPITLIFRNVLPENGFMPGNHVPTGVLCNRSTFMMGGWKECFSAAGIASAKIP
jgi:hypothetical protein